MTQQADTTPPVSLKNELIRLMCVTMACSVTEVVCYGDAAHVYAGIMTGNTVQLGWALSAGQYAKALPIAIALGSFFIGCVVASFFRVQLRPLRRVYWLMASLLTMASFIRFHMPLHLFVELPLLAFTMALQGEGLSQFAGVKLQTVVVTNNLVKFAKALTERYINPGADPSNIPSRADVLVPGVCWCTFFTGAGLGALLSLHHAYPLIVPIILLLFLGASERASA
jgi:uncharacterized membrane protein YoaK (UPF0700 family)